MSKVIEGEFSEEKWDIKKVVLGLVVLATLAYAGYFAKTTYLDPHPKTEVAGVSTQNEPDQASVASPVRRHISIPNAGDVQDKIDQVQSQVTNLNVAEIASSSPQIQKVIHDMQSLGNYPRDQAKQMCTQMCSGL